jgi:cholesterol 25-hydroxylase
VDRFLHVDSPRLAEVARSPPRTFHGRSLAVVWVCRVGIVALAALHAARPQVLDGAVAAVWRWLLTQSWYQNQYMEAWYPLVFYPLCLAYFYGTGALIGNRWRIDDGSESVAVPRERRIPQVEGPLKIASGFIIYLLSPFLLEWRKTARVDRLPEAAPTFAVLAVETLLSMLIFDFLFFWAHLAMHRVPAVYRTVHKEHHRDITTAPVDANWVHAVERLTLVLSAAFSITIVGAHYLTRNVFTSWAVFLLVENHTGYDAPWFLCNVVPGDIVSGPRRHFLHHRHGDVFYGEYFTYLDNWLARVRGWTAKAH